MFLLNHQMVKDRVGLICSWILISLLHTNIDRKRKNFFGYSQEYKE